MTPADAGRALPKPRRRSAHRGLHRGRGLAEQDRAFLGGADAALVRIDLLDHGVGALNRGPGADRFEPALEVREILDPLALALMRHDPGIARHVGDAVVARE